MTNPGPKAFRADIQGLRAVAIVVVLAYHAGFELFSGGFVGVDVFFVISGYLITRHLIDEIDRTEKLSFARFYARRARRILPAALTVALLTTVISALVLAPVRALQVVNDAIATVLFVPNYWFARTATDYLANKDPSPFQHYWSLGVEEQFYVLWPMLLVITVVVFRGRRVLPVVLGLVAAASLLAAEVTMASGVSLAFYSVTTRAWEFAVGGLVALTAAGTGRILMSAPNWVRAVVGWLGLSAILVSSLLYDANSHFPGVGALAPVLGTAVIIAIGSTATRGGPSVLLGLRPLQFLGLISYSLYLVHWPILNLTQSVTGGPLPAPLALALVVVSVPIAWGMYRLVEQPFVGDRPLARTRPKVVFGGALAAVAVALTVSVSTFVAISAIPLTSADPADVASREATPYVPTNLTPPLDTAAASVASLYSNGCHAPVAQISWKDCRFGSTTGAAVVALFGDSHAANWFPALELLAADKGFELRAFTKSGCHAADVSTQNDGTNYRECGQWRQSVVDELTANPPDVVVIADRAYDTTPGDSAAERNAGISRTVAALAVRSQVVVIADTPRFSSDRATCLSTNLNDALACAGNSSNLPSTANTQAHAATLDAGARYVDFSDSFCFDSVCPAIIGPYLVYRDDQHLTVEFSRSLSTEVWRQLSPAIEPFTR